jgi:hypothetical protein
MRLVWASPRGAITMGEPLERTKPTIKREITIMKWKGSI